MKQHKSLLSIKKVPSEHILTLTFCHKFKSEQHFGQIIKKELNLGVFFSRYFLIIYYLHRVVCVKILLECKSVPR